MILIDTNVILDVFDRDPHWFEWSATKISEIGGQSAGLTNVVVLAELSRSFDGLYDLQRALQSLEIEVLPLSETAAFEAGKRFQTYRRTRSAAEQARVLPDFFIGAHAATLGATLLTRDARLYRRYFPDLTLITPETDHG